jgi:replicative DNA helicase
MFVDMDVRDKILPYLTVDVFDDGVCIDIVKTTLKYLDKYQKFPSTQQMKLLNSDVWDAFVDICDMDVSEYDRDFILDMLEEFYKKKLAREIILEANNSLDTEDDVKLNSTPDKLREALSFTFDTNIGLSVLTDAERMYSALHDRDKVVSTGLKTLDDLIEGGFHEKSLTLVLAECVTEDGNVRIRILKDSDSKIEEVKDLKTIRPFQYYIDAFDNNIWEYKECQISDILSYKNGYKVEIDSPDGYVPVTHYIHKGVKQIWKVETDNGYKFECSGKHVVDTRDGLKFVEELNSDDELLTIDGYFHCKTRKQGYSKPVIDIRVEHENHRFFYENVSVKNSNLGKSLIKCSLSTNSLLQNKNVLYISLEMSEEKISERILANLFDINLSDLKMLDKNKFTVKLEKYQTQLQSNFYVVAYPPKSVNSNRIRSILKELQLKKKFVPDIIFVDYLGLMSPNASNKNANSYSEQKTISEELRAIAVEFGMPIVSAVQTNRGGFGNAELDLTDVADSVGTVATADIIFGVTQTQEMREAGRYTFLLLKNRYGENKKKRYIGVDYPKMRIFDLVEDEDDIKKPAESVDDVVDNLMRKDRNSGKKKIIDFN